MAKKIAKEYYLMHKDIPVCLMELTEGGTLGNYRKNEAALAHFPIGGQMNDMKFHDWWKDRAIPKTRHGAKTALQRLGYSSTNSALVDNLALSLSDCYWIKPRGEDIEWKDVNLFTNDFVDTFGEITLNKDNLLDLRKKTKFNCAASQGELQKKAYLTAFSSLLPPDGSSVSIQDQNSSQIGVSSSRRFAFLSSGDNSLYKCSLKNRRLQKATPFSAGSRFYLPL